MGYIKCKISVSTYALTFVMAFGLFYSLFVIAKTFQNFEFKFFPLFGLFIFLVVYLLALSYIKNVKYIIITERTIKYFSLSRPWVTSLKMADYKSKFLTTETGSNGRYKVLYLIDMENNITLKIMGLHYKNFDDMNEAIDLPELKYRLGGVEYFKLLFFGKLNISKNKKNQGKHFISLSIILNLLERLLSFAIALFLATVLIKWLF